MTQSKDTASNIEIAVLPSTQKGVDVRFGIISRLATKYGVYILPYVDSSDPSDGLYLDNDKQNSLVDNPHRYAAHALECVNNLTASDILDSRIRNTETGKLTLLGALGGLVIGDPDGDCVQLLPSENVMRSSIVEAGMSPTRLRHVEYTGKNYADGHIPPKEYGKRMKKGEVPIAPWNKYLHGHDTRAHSPMRHMIDDETVRTIFMRTANALGGRAINRQPQLVATVWEQLVGRETLVGFAAYELLVRSGIESPMTAQYIAAGAEQRSAARMEQFLMKAEARK